jgi:hypothetical protein
MPSTYTLNNGIELIGTGEQSGTWGDTTNVNLGLIDTALDGQVTITLASAGTSGAPNALPISDGAASNGRNRLVIFDDGGDLGATAFVQLTPNDAEKIVYVRNNLSGGRAITLFQGTYNASNDYEVPAGTTAVVFFNGGGAGAVAANVFNNAFFDSLRLGAVSVTAILDEDNMASDSATALATQQSIKAYVDAQVGANNELSEVLANGNTTGGTDIAVSSGDDITFADNSKAIFGAGSDLQIYHNTTGFTGNIIASATNNLYIRSNSLYFQKADGTENNMFAISDGAVSLAYDNAVKLATTATGIDVTGTVTADGLTVAGTAFINLTTRPAGVPATAGALWAAQTETGNYGIASRASATDAFTYIGNTGSSATLGTSYGTTGSYLPLDIQTSDTKRIRADANGDISFYEDTGTTPLFFWDASTERLGIGTSSPSNKLTVSAGSGDGIFVEDNSAANSSPYIKVRGKRSDANTSQAFAGKLLLDGHRTDAAVPNAKNLGSVAFGGNHTDGSDANILYSASISGISEGTFSNATTMPTGLAFYTGSTGRADTTFGVTFGTERMRITSTGSVGIGTSAPTHLFTVGEDNSNNPGKISLGRGGLEEANIFFTRAGVNDAEITYNADEDLFIKNNFAAGDVVYSNNLGAHIFNTGSAGVLEAMRITSTGSVGIGTSSPAYRLDVSSIGGSIARFINGSSGGTPSTTHGEIIVESGEANMGLQLLGTSTSNQKILFGDVASSGAGQIEYSHASDYMALFTGATERLRITSTGSVGIGTSSPAYNFVVSAAGASGIEFAPAYSGTANLVQHYSRSGGVYVDAVNEAAQHRFNTAGTERMRIDASGNVGIGTSSPAAKLHIEDDAGSAFRVENITNTSFASSLFVDDTGAGLTITNYGSAYASGSLLNVGAGGVALSSTTDMAINASGAKTLRFGTNSTERMRIDSSGNLLVGTTTIGAGNRMNVVGNNVVFSPNTDGKGTHTFTTAAADVGVYAIKSDTTTTVQLHAGGNSYFNGGNVGIGTSSPAEKLQINGGVLLTSANNSADTVDGAILDYFSGNTRLVASRSGATDASIQFFTTSSGTLAERMRIDASGDLLVGTTTSPTSPSNTAVIVSGGVRTASNLLSSIASGTATTAFSITSGNRGRYEVVAMIANSGDASLYSAISTVLWDGSTGRAVSNNGTNFTITLSGSNVQVTQTSGSAQNVYWSVQRIAL